MEVKRIDEKAVAIRLRALRATAGKKKAGGLTAKEIRKQKAEAAAAKKRAAKQPAGKAATVTGDVPRRRRPERTAVPLPIPGQRNVLITSALPYVNNVPHLGNLIGSMLSADVFARFCRQRGLNTLYICGTDEYGTATETKAQEEGLTPRAICDKYHAIHKKVYDWFDISFDKFGRTSAEDPHNSADWPQTQIAQAIFKDLHDNGNISEQEVEQMYCTDCNRFLADRFIEGTCPLCGYEDARGDQCDGCGKLVNAPELKNPRCKANSKHHVEVRTSQHLFLDLPKLSPKLRAWLDEASANWSKNSVIQTNAWFNTGLQERCITRDLKWGTPVPLDGYRDKVFYVWFGAPIGYISITACATDEWRKWWQNPENVQLYQFMGKDNVPFHTVIFPASLIGTEKTWTKLHQLSTTEYLNYEKTKFSKSRSVGVFGTDAEQTGIPSEVWRYYLLITRPENDDADFQWADFAERTNNELLKNLGNFVNRVIALTNKFCAGVAPALGEETKTETDLREAVDAELKLYIEDMEATSLRSALRHAMSISALGNGYLQHTQPWVLAKSDKPRCSTVLAAALSLAKLVSAVLEPFMPGFTDKVCHQLDIAHSDIPDNFSFDFPAGHKIKAAEPIFRALSHEEIEGHRARFSGAATPGAGAGAGAGKKGQQQGKGKGKGKGNQQKGKGKQKGQAGGKKKNGPKPPSDVSAIEMRVGVITKVWHHPDADRLFCEEIDIGEPQPRQIASGLREFFTLDQMLGQRVVVIANLKAKAMRGFVSHGMVLCAERTDDGVEKVEFAEPPAEAKVGERITVEGFSGEPHESINPAKKKNNPWLDVSVDLVVKEGVATYKGVPLMTSAGAVKPKSLQEAKLK